MGLLLERWNNQIKKKITDTNNKSNNNTTGSKTNTLNSGSTFSTLKKNLASNSVPSTSSSAKKSSGSTNKNSQYTGYQYTIGSDYGKQVAQNMGIGENFTATDGSVWTKEKDGTITVRKNGQTYTNVYKPSDLGTLGKQQIAAGLPYEYVEQTLNDRRDKIANNPGLSQYAYDGTYQMLYDYIQNQKNASLREEYEEERPDDYTNPYKEEIDYLLNQILNREDFSYNAMNDPLYQQYANMYRREGDRAMKETLAEAAAGAGGMNTYAITAAQQANSYYGSKLNDMIPQLYQLAYDMYINDKESKVQDLGILQNMDATQYNRYRDTIQDYYNDKNFAYGAYQDAVQQGNFQTNFGYNAMLDNRNFNNSEYWNNKEFDYNDMWANKEWDASQADKEYERNQYEQEKAYNKIMDWIGMGVTSFSPEDLAKAGLTQEDVNLLIAAVQAQQGQTGRTSSGGGSRRSSSGSGGGGYTGDDGYAPTAPTTTYAPNSDLDAGTENYQAISAACETLLAQQGKSAVLNYLKDALATGVINQSSYMTLVNRYRG